MSAPTNLVTIRPGVTFQADAAASFQRVEKRAGRRVDVNSTYRDWDEQMKLYLAYQRDPKNNPLALHPDYSMHCRGLALDSDDHTLMRSMGDYGWRATVSSEPWHFDYFRSLDKHYGEPAGGDAVPLPPPTTKRKRGSDMVLFFTRKNNVLVWALAGTSPGTPANWLETKLQSLANQWAAQVGGNAAELSESQFEAWKKDYLAPVKTRTA